MHKVLYVPGGCLGFLNHHQYEIDLMCIFECETFQFFGVGKNAIYEMEANSFPTMKRRAHIPTGLFPFCPYETFKGKPPTKKADQNVRVRLFVNVVPLRICTLSLTNRDPRDLLEIHPLFEICQNI